MTVALGHEKGTRLGAFVQVVCRDFCSGGVQIPNPTLWSTPLQHEVPFSSLSMFVITAMVAQKPLDRGIHKRRLGRFISFWKEKTKRQIDLEKVTALKTLAPSEVILP